MPNRSVKTTTKKGNIGGPVDTETHSSCEISTSNTKFSISTVSVNSPID